MRVAPLAELYQHQSDYRYHQRRLQSIMHNHSHPHRDNSLDFERMELVRQNLQKF